MNPFRKRSSASDGKRNSIYDLEAPRPLDSYLAKTANGRASTMSLSAQHYLTRTSAGRGSLLSIPPTDEHVLETTTIGDLIRALELVHTQAVTEPRADDSPKRKVGTATPPRMPSVMTLFSDVGPRRGSLKPPLTTSYSNPLQYRSQNPPPYSAATAYPPSPKPIRRRFSVRPSNLAYPPGQCPRRSGSISLDTPLNSSSSSLTVPTTTLQRRLSTRPSPLAHQNQNLLTVPANKPPWRPTLLRSDSERVSLQRGHQTTTPRNRHSSLCQMDNQNNNSGGGGGAS